MTTKDMAKLLSEFIGVLTVMRDALDASDNVPLVTLVDPVDPADLGGIGDPEPEHTHMFQDGRPCPCGVPFGHR